MTFYPITSDPRADGPLLGTLNAPVESGVMAAAAPGGVLVYPTVNSVATSTPCGPLVFLPGICLIHRPKQSSDAKFSDAAETILAPIPGPGEAAEPSPDGLAYRSLLAENKRQAARVGQLTQFLSTVMQLSRGLRHNTTGKADYPVRGVCNSFLRLLDAAIGSATEAPSPTTSTNGVDPSSFEWAYRDLQKENERLSRDWKDANARIETLQKGLATVTAINDQSQKAITELRESRDRLSSQLPTLGRWEAFRRDIGHMSDILRRTLDPRTNAYDAVDTFLSVLTDRIGKVIPSQAETTEEGAPT